ncbi:ATP-binding protein [Haliscomenobacter sp.]|uniref:ATP-binding protein n=1 Tax=Haliscomenobacter sp. TaxID=2717303 RepID=UPI003BABE774
MKTPFKFLDAYAYQDRDNFFGREDETEELYRMVFKSSLILIYGLSGTGKTSLVQCGLASKFDGPDWFPFFLRRGADFNQSLDQTIQGVMPKDAAAITALPDRISYLFRYYLRPVYLIFDQFEELFILGTEKEQQILAETLVKLTQMEAACRVILIVREEFIGQLYNLEKQLPRLFDFRLRVEPMGYSKVTEVVEKSCKNYHISLEEPIQQSTKAIYDNISGGKSGIQLPYLQVYLDQLYRDAFLKKYPDQNVPNTETWPQLTFNLSGIKALGDIEDVLGRFLDEQKWQLQSNVGQQYTDSPEDAVSTVLDAFVTPEGTKRPVTYTGTEANLVLDAQVAQWLSGINPQTLGYIIRQLINRRILRQSEHSLELAHDALALLIDQKRSETQRRVNEVLSRLLIAHKEFLETKETLSKKQINVIEELWPTLKPRLSADLLAFVEQSKAELLQKEQAELLAEREKRRRATRAAAVAIVLATLSIAALVFAIVKAEQTRRAKNELAKAFVNGQIQVANTLKVEGKYEAAQEKLRAIDDLNVGITQPLQDTLSKLTQRWGEVQKLVEQATALTQDEDFFEVIKLYQKAQMISADERIAGLIKETENKLEITYKKLIDAGDGFVGRYNDLARESYEKALRLKPGDGLATRKLNLLN